MDNPYYYTLAAVYKYSHNNKDYRSPNVIFIHPEISEINKFMEDQLDLIQQEYGLVHLVIERYHYGCVLGGATEIEWYKVTDSGYDQCSKPKDWKSVVCVFHSNEE